MTVVLVDSEPELVRHLDEPAARLPAVQWRQIGHADLEPLATDAAAIVVAIGADLDADFALVGRLKAAVPACKVIAVASAPLDPSHRDLVTTSGCDDLLVSPMAVTELRDAVAVQLGLRRPGAELVTALVIAPTGSSSAMISNLSVDGARLVASAGLAEGVLVTLVLTAGEGDEAARLQLPGVVTWSQPRDGKHVVGIAFGRGAGTGEPLDAGTRTALTALTQWALVREGAHLRVIPRGDFTEATSFDGLAARLVGRVIFDCEHITYMNSMGVRAWCDFLRAVRIQGYELHACSTAFALQASMVHDVVGRGTVVSCFAPYHCAACDRSTERLLQAATVLALGGEPPAFRCRACGGIDEFDDLPDRYFSFLTADD